MKFFDFEHDMKMADQIEMSTAENSTGNPFGPVTNYLGKQPNVRNTFLIQYVSSTKITKFIMDTF